MPVTENLGIARIAEAINTMQDLREKWAEDKRYGSDYSERMVILFEAERLLKAYLTSAR